MMQHFGVDLGSMSDQTNEVAEVSVGDVDHGCNRKSGRTVVIMRDRGLLFHCISFIRSTIAIKRDCRPTPTKIIKQPI